jgi:hypothetical protein
VDQQAAGGKDALDLREGMLRSGHVVARPEVHDEVERRVGKRQVAHVALDQLRLDARLL